MEIYRLYNFTITFLETLFSTIKTMNPEFTGGFPSYGAWLLTGLAAALGLWIALFLLEAFGLYYMAKKQGLPKRYLAFIPFANTLYMSKLAGECRFFGRKMKYAGLYALIAQILSAIVCGMVIAAQMYLYIGCGDPTPIKENMGGVEVVTGVYWENLSGFANVVFNFFYYSSYIVSIFELAYEVLILVVVMALLKKYAPRNYFILSLLTLFVPVSRYIIIFVLRNRNPIDYEAYMRRQRADYIRRQQAYYNQFGNPYDNPYGTPNGAPYGGQNGQNPQNPQNPNPQGGQSAANDDPFEEFSSNNANPASGQNAANAGGNSDTGTQDKDEFFN